MHCPGITGEATSPGGGKLPSPGEIGCWQLKRYRRGLSGEPRGPIQEPRAAWSDLNFKLK